MTIPQMIFLFIAAALGGTLNAVAGGGTFITLPTLIFTGVLPVQANTTSTVALWPAAVASTGAYRKELAAQQKSFLALMIGTSLIGGYLGAQLLLGTSQSTFVLLLPYLMLLATLLFTFSPMITKKLRSLHTGEQSRPSWLTWAGMSVAQLVIAVYGGYFGGGIGILMLATLAMMGMENIHEMNAVKTLLNACINAVAVVTFIARGAVLWPQAILMIVASIVGGYGGAYYARKIEQKWIRLFVMFVGFAMTIYFFIKAFLM
jgi:uncharacterized membrane protein YfcA